MPSAADAWAAAALAEAAARAAAHLVDVNLATVPDDALDNAARISPHRPRLRRATSRSRRRERRDRVPAWSLTAGRAAAIDAPGRVARAGHARLGDRRLRAAPSTSASSTAASTADHPLVGGLASAVAVVDGEDDAFEVVDGRDRATSCGHGTACAGIVRSLAPDCRLHSVRVLGAGRDGRRRPDPRRAPPRDRGRLPRDQPQPLDDEAPLRRGAARARGRRVLQQDGARRVRAQPAGRELPVALLVGDLGREPRGRRSADLVREPDPSGRVLRPRRRRRRRVARRRHAPLHRQQLRGAAHRGRRGARAREASRADPVPAEERPPPDGDTNCTEVEHERRDSNRAAAAPGCSAATRRATARCCSRSWTSPGRSSARRPRRSSSSTRSDDELVFEAVSGQGEASLVGTRFPSSTGIAGFALVTRQPLVVDDLAARPALRARPRPQSTGYVPDEHRRVAPAPRRARARRPVRARPRAPTARSGSRSSTSSHGSRRRRRSARPAPARPTRAGRPRRRPATPALVGRARRAARREGRRRGHAAARGARAAPQRALRRADPQAGLRQRSGASRTPLRRRRDLAPPSARAEPRGVSSSDRSRTDARPRLRSDDLAVLDATRRRAASSTVDLRAGDPRSRPRTSVARCARTRPAPRSSRARPTSRLLLSTDALAWAHSHTTRGRAEIFPHFWWGCTAGCGRPARHGSANRVRRRAPRARSDVFASPRAPPPPARLGRLDARRLGVPRRARRLRVRPGRRGGGRARRR